MLYPRRHAFHFASLALGVALLVGCANYVAEGEAALRTAKPCCASLTELPTGRPATADQDVELRPDSPHYDFGNGLAPFVRLLLEPGSEKLIEIKARDRLGGKVGGGGYKYPDIRLVFLDRDHMIVPQEEPAPPTVIGGRLTWKSRAPASASEMIVTSWPRSNGRLSEASQERRSATYMVGGAFVSTPGGTGTTEFTFVPYGEAKIEVLGVLLQR